ncbi:MAG: DsrE family protein [Gammaproteobacteria bacterium]|nr:DsrE family protein [Gammaproteobacteria bacterium]
MKRLLLAATLCVFSTIVLAETHYLAIQVNENDPRLMNLALNNARNVERYYKESGDDVVIEIVTYGPGLNMLVKGKSPVAERISTMIKNMGNISFSACENTRKAMSRSAGKEIELLDEAKSVPSGVVRLMELQEGGYSYIRP